MKSFETENMLEPISFKNDKIINHAINQTIQTFISDVQNHLPSNCYLTENISDGFTPDRNFTELLIDYNNEKSYFFMPDFKLSIDSDQNELLSTVLTINHHFTVWDASSHNTEYILLCNWHEGMHVRTSFDVLMTCKEMYSDILKRLAETNVKINSISLIIDFIG